MKKVLFLQNEGNNYGGVVQVNRLVGEELLNHNFNVSIISIRNTKNTQKNNIKTKINEIIINEKETWGTYQGREILKEIKQIHLFKGFKMVCSRIKYKISIKKDTKKLHNIIHEIKPDYIIASHYELLNMIPTNYLSKTIHQQHSSFSDFSNHRATMNTFRKYNNKIKFLWLSKNTSESTKKAGLNNNYYIYNAVRFKCNKKANVIKNKKLITIARLAAQKDIETMVDIVEEIFKDKAFDEWNLEIYGNGPEEEKIKRKIKNKRIKLMGPTNNPKEKLLSSSINLNTSIFEGFSMSILEAQECGVPTISLNYWESVYEQIKDNSTGLIAENKKEFINKLKELMINSKKLEKMSNQCKEFSKEFQIEELIKNWIKLFKEIDKSN